MPHPHPPKKKTLSQVHILPPPPPPPFVPSSYCPPPPTPTTQTPNLSPVHILPPHPPKFIPCSYPPPPKEIFIHNSPSHPPFCPPVHLHLNPPHPSNMSSDPLPPPPPTPHTHTFCPQIHIDPQFPSKKKNSDTVPHFTAHILRYKPVCQVSICFMLDFTCTSNTGAPLRHQQYLGSTPAPAILGLHSGGACVNPLCPRPPVTAHSFSLLRDPRPPGSGRLADAPY